MSYPSTPPPIDAEEIPPYPLPASISGPSRTSFPISYNRTTDYFEIGNAAFKNDERGLRNLANYLIHFTISEDTKPAPKAVLPTNRPRHLISKYVPRVPNASRQISHLELDDIVNAILSDEKEKE